jgi:inosose dehydratase
MSGQLDRGGAGAGSPGGSGARIRPASAPCCFGVDEVLPPDAWMPDPGLVLDAIAELGYPGTELGPPGYLGRGPEVRDALELRGLQLVGSFLPLHFSRADRFAEERAGFLRDALALLGEATPAGERPFAVLCEGLEEPARMAFAGRIADHPEAWLPAGLHGTLVDNLHRAAEDCRAAGFEPVIHPHAGTYVETEDEIRRLMDAIDPSLVGLCLDTGHARFGGADPVTLAEDYFELLRHVHLKDVSSAAIEQGRTEGADFVALTAAGAFTPLGEGDARIADVVAVLDRRGWDGWVVVEQDRYLFPGEELDAIVDVQRRNRAFLAGLGI